MQKIMINALIAASCLVGSGTAMATDAHFTVTEGDTIIASWVQSLTPTPIFSDTGKGTTISITDGTGLVAGDTFINYFSAVYAPEVVNASSYALGGLYDENLLDLSGLQYYSQTEGKPLFLLGVYSGTNEFDGNQTTLTISVPEPSTWAVMLLGLGMVGISARRRPKVRITYA